MVRFELKLSSYGPLTARFECSAEAIVQFSTEHTFFVILSTLQCLSDVCMYEKSVSTKLYSP